MANSRAENIAALQRTPATLVQLTSSLTDAALDLHPGPGEWSIREILAHLVDDEMYVMRLRLERIIKEDNPHLTPHDEKRWYATRNTTRDALGELLTDFAVQRAASLGIIGTLRESDWARKGVQPEYGAFTAEGWLATWAQHDATHLRQIEATLAAHTK
ncbi:MAG TPA: DinB family protein [Ktedonobacterales bacterium]